MEDYTVTILLDNDAGEGEELDSHVFYFDNLEAAEQFFDILAATPRY